MTTILQRPVSMSFIAPHPYTDTPSDQLQFRPPLTQLHNRNTGSRTAQEQLSSWLERTKSATYVPHTTSSSQSLYTPALTPDVPSANSMLGPQTGGLYRTNNNVEGFSQRPSRPRSPLDEISPKHVDSTQESVDRGQADNSDQIAPYLQIPSAINSSKASLSEFAAQITCLFWFESSMTLSRVENSSAVPSPTAPLVTEAKPSLGFRKWVTTILSTTQVSGHVVLLALMFIYRLKKLNPTVKGKPGSEYRLLTVALMLGNKFLDDNTYTNKTWAEVSGISVSEIHIMEVEFLSNMRYTLYASKDEWNEWLKKLGRFWDYFDKASKAAALAQLAGLSTPTTPTHMQAPYPLTPSRSHISSPMSHAHPSTPSSIHSRPTHPLAMPPHLPPNLPSPMSSMSDFDARTGGRKRSRDESMEDRPAKRLSTNFSLPPQANYVLPPAHASMAHPYDNTTHRLPLPNTSMHGGPKAPMPMQYTAHLPPPTNRAMAAVYAQPPHQAPLSDLLKPQPQAPPSLGLRIPSMADQTRGLPSVIGSKSSSPTAVALTPTAEMLSPLAYNFQRNSPYRPIRGVNTLLVPPPSASLHNPSQSIGAGDLRYQPLAKNTTERKTGVVPYQSSGYQTQSWPSQNQFHR